MLKHRIILYNTFINWKVCKVSYKKIFEKKSSCENIRAEAEAKVEAKAELELKLGVFLKSHFHLKTSSGAKKFD